MSQFRYSLSSLAIGLVLAGVPLLAVATGRLEAWPALCLLIGLSVGALVGGFVERYRPVRLPGSEAGTIEPAETSVFRIRRRLPDARSHHA